jgi:hypothetical protein
MVSNNKAKVPKKQQRLNSPAKIKRVMQGELRYPEPDSPICPL